MWNTTRLKFRKNLKFTKFHYQFPTPFGQFDESSVRVQVLKYISVNKKFYKNITNSTK